MSTTDELLCPAETDADGEPAAVLFKVRVADSGHDAGETSEYEYFVMANDAAQASNHGLRLHVDGTDRDRELPRVIQAEPVKVHTAQGFVSPDVQLFTVVATDGETHHLWLVTAACEEAAYAAGAKLWAERTSEPPANIYAALGEVIAAGSLL